VQGLREGDGGSGRGGGVTLRLIVKRDDAGMAANVGGSVLSTFASFDVEIPELEKLLTNATTYTHAQVIGVEVLSLRAEADEMGVQGG
jgi:hypothetical protein